MAKNTPPIGCSVVAPVFPYLYTLCAAASAANTNAEQEEFGEFDDEAVFHEGDKAE